MSKKLYEILGVEENELIQIRNGWIIMNCTVGEKVLGMPSPGFESWEDTCLLLLGRHQWRPLPVPESDEVEEFFDAVLTLHPRAASIARCDSAQTGSFFRLYDKDGCCFCSIYDNPGYTELELGRKYPLIPEEIPWRTVEWKAQEQEK